jgi:hypothetical protein
VTNFSNGQKFVTSQEFSLIKFDESQFRNLQDSDSEFDGYVKIHIIDGSNEKFKEVEVFFETYDNDAKVEELINTDLVNVRKIIKVDIFECACYCNTSKYYWLITNKNEWISLPVIEQEDYEFRSTTRDYVFADDNQNTIFLYEFQDEVIEEEHKEKPVFRQKSKKIITTFLWNGEEIKNI